MPITMEVTSSAFQAGEAIPTEIHVRRSEHLTAAAVERGARCCKKPGSDCDDPDAPVGTWVHWVLYDLPVTAAELAEKILALERLSFGAKQGINDFKRVGYGGPCPPPGKPHRYYFKLYALEADLLLKPRATKQELLRAMDGHILAEAQLSGTYQRKR